VRIWDPHTGQARHTLTGHINWVRALAAAPDGSWLASVSEDGTARMWDVDAGRCVASLRTAHALGCVVTYGARVAVAGDRGPYFFAVAGC
jgi:WD40 repeat protein